MDLKNLVGESVFVRLYRKKTFHTYHGRLTDVNSHSICLEVDGRSKWLSKPIMYKDVIELEL